MTPIEIILSGFLVVSTTSHVIIVYYWVRAEKRSRGQEQRNLKWDARNEADYIRKEEQRRKWEQMPEKEGGDE